MGFVQSWVAVKSEKISNLLAYLKLRPNGSHWESADGDYSYADLCNGWHIVVSNKRGKFFTETPAVLAEISFISDLLAGAIEEHVNYSVCEFWQSGKKVWKVEYAHDEPPKLVTEGPLPECFPKIKEECEALQAADKGTDYLIEIPLRVCEQLCRYVHDRAIEGIGDEPFEILEPISPHKQSSSRTLADIIRSLFTPKQ